MSRQPARPAEPPALAIRPEAVEDVADEFCYELAQALRRILGLNEPAAPWNDEEEDDGLADPQTTAD